MEPLDEPKSFTDKPKKSFTETLGVSASVFHAVVQAHGPSFDNMKSSLGIQAALSIEQRGLTSSGKKNSKKKNKKVSKQPDGFAFTITATDSKQLAKKSSSATVLSGEQRHDKFQQRSADCHGRKQAWRTGV